MNPITAEVVDQIIARAERYTARLSESLAALEKLEFGSDGYVARFQQTKIIQQDAAAAMYLARLARYELEAQQKPKP